MRHVGLRLLVVFPLLAVLAPALGACGRAQALEEDYEARWAVSAHADTKSPSFAHWDNDVPPVVPADCAKCHSTHGYLTYLGVDGSTPGEVDQPAPAGTTIECDACHNDVAEGKTFTVMPSGTTIAGLGQESNCVACHQGRASAEHVAEAALGLPRDEVSAELSMPRIHNNPAGATFHGAEAKGGGEYTVREYTGQFYHGFDNCTTCHDSHALSVHVEKCGACHLGATTLEGVRNIRLTKTDYDGDGDVSEGVSGEIETMQERLLTTMLVYTAAAAGPAAGTEQIAYDDGFVNDDGDPYTTWTPELMQAAYNYEYVVADPGAYSHNPRYVLQLLYDSIQDLGGNVVGMTRPAP